MDTQGYYEDLKALAHEKRVLYGVKTSAFGLREARVIYKAEGIKIDLRKLTPRIKGIYMCADGDYSVAIHRDLPDEPKLFALVHELKHHYRDQAAITSGALICGDYNANALIEKGAEVFAAEFIYPETEFAQDARAMKTDSWQAEDVVLFKRGCKAKVSYRFLCKRLEWHRLASAGAFDGVKFQKLEEKMFGVPFYKRRKVSI